MKNKVQTKKLTMMAVLCALSIVFVYFIRTPIFPAAPWMEYDAGDIPILVGAMIYSPAAGVMVAVVVSAIQAFTVSAGSGWIGLVMHICATGAAVLVAGLIYHKKHTRRGAALALVCGMLTAVVLMIPLNLIFTPMFGTPLEFVKQMIWPVIVPFNLIKFGINSLVTFLLYGQLEKFVNKN